MSKKFMTLKISLKTIYLSPFSRKLEYREIYPRRNPPRISPLCPRRKVRYTQNQSFKKRWLMISNFQVKICSQLFVIDGFVHVKAPGSRRWPGLKCTIECPRYLNRNIVGLRCCTPRLGFCGIGRCEKHPCDSH